MILALNASCFFKMEVILGSLFAAEVKKLQQEQFKPSEQVTLQPFERDHACVVGGYRVPQESQTCYLVLDRNEPFFFVLEIEISYQLLVIF
ncbi:hypothetical protein MKW94_002318 [Papaver nudicaule]|uniref:rRNA 2'-O-methyltransferase fibrillarin n=1 Tax=Papaver nudicaule TaxID=74823 RepID=A0AA41RRJ2_PAPNU|nr:hypothetical protein [Papaver nudicaule]